MIRVRDQKILKIAQSIQSGGNNLTQKARDYRVSKNLVQRISNEVCYEGYVNLRDF
jgi:hypothetical protein